MSVLPGTGRHGSPVLLLCPWGSASSPLNQGLEEVYVKAPSSTMSLCSQLPGGESRGRWWYPHFLAESNLCHRGKRRPSPQLTSLVTAFLFFPVLGRR